ncbi:MAG: efflux RND transporter periplasmic adaptor subunit [Polyangiaceae bacterium]|nr:efflux RND transporter periplasmic adaptor subunit [Polyangiaceae bacterium]
MKASSARPIAQCLTLLSMAACLAACEQQATVRPKSTGKAHVRLQVTRGPLRSSLLLYGRLEAVRAERLVAPKTEMWSVNIRRLVEDGSTVKKGDVVVEFDNSAFVNRLSENRLALQAAEAELERQLAANDATLADRDIAVARAEIGLKKAELEAAVPQDAYPLRVYQEKQLARERALSELAKAQEAQQSAQRAAALDLKVRQIAIEKAKKQLEETQRGLEALTLRAPQDGLVIVADNRRERRTFQAGDTLWPGATVATLPDLSAYQFVAQLSDVDDGQIQTGAETLCFIDAYPDEPLKGKVLSISPVAQRPSRDSNRRFFVVTVELPSATKHPLRPGMSVRAEVLRRHENSALLVPRAALSGSVGKFSVKEASGPVHPVRVDFCSPELCAVAGAVAVGTELLEAL